MSATDQREMVDHPEHYGGKDNPLEVINIIEHYGLGFSDGNAVKYILRAGRKDPAAHVQDLEKARWYLDREISRRRSRPAVTDDEIEAMMAGPRGAPDRPREGCSQCGQSFESPACGPTHALVAAERRPEARTGRMPDPKAYVVTCANGGWSPTHFQVLLIDNTNACFQRANSHHWYYLSDEGVTWRHAPLVTSARAVDAAERAPGPDGAGV